MISKTPFRLWRIDGQNILDEIKVLVSYYTTHDKKVVELELSPLEYKTLLGLTGNKYRIGIIKNLNYPNEDYVITVSKSTSRPTKTILVSLDVR